MSQSRQVEDMVTSLRNMNNITANRAAAFLELLFIEKEALVKCLRSAVSVSTHDLENPGIIRRMGWLVDEDDADDRFFGAVVEYKAGPPNIKLSVVWDHTPVCILPVLGFTATKSGTRLAAPADNASSPGERDPLVTMDSGAADTCPAGINPGWDGCERCGATSDEECRDVTLPQKGESHD